MNFRYLLLLACAATAMLACGDDGGNADAMAVSCQLEDRDDTYVAGLEKTGANGVTVVLVEATPAPPAKDDNSWLLRVLDGTQTPLPGLEVTVTPFMPDHGHGTPVVTEVTEQAETGEYVADPVNLWMPGLWQTTVEITDNDAISDSVMFSFCIEG